MSNRKEIDRRDWMYIFTVLDREIQKCDYVLYSNCNASTPSEVIAKTYGETDGNRNNIVFVKSFGIFDVYEDTKTKYIIDGKEHPKQFALLRRYGLNNSRRASDLYNYNIDSEKYDGKSSHFYLYRNSTEKRLLPIAFIIADDERCAKDFVLFVNGEYLGTPMEYNNGELAEVFYR